MTANFAQNVTSGFIEVPQGDEDEVWRKVVWANESCRQVAVDVERSHISVRRIPMSRQKTTKGRKRMRPWMKNSNPIEPRKELFSALSVEPGAN